MPSDSRPASSHSRLYLRAPGRALALSHLLARALPADARAVCEALVRRGGVRIDGTRARDGAALVPAGARVEVERLGTHGAALRDVPLAALGAHGARVLAPAPAWPTGEVLLEVSGEEDGPAERMRFQVLERRGALASLQVWPEPARLETALRGLAALGCPALGDVWNGGVAVDGGLRVAPWFEGASGAGAEPALIWPGEPVFAGGPPEMAGRGSGQPPRLMVSDASARALERGHPWVLRDDESGDTSGCAPGTLLRLRSTGGRDAGTAICEGEGGDRIARRWSAPGARPRSVAARVRRALERRSELLAAGDTDVYRLVHAEADELPGLAVDRLGPLLRVLCNGRACEGYRDAAVSALIDQLRERLGEQWRGDPPVVQVVQLRRAARGRFECAWLARGELPEAGDVPPGVAPGAFLVRERGLAFWVEPGLADPSRPTPGFGLYPDQRVNRERLSRLARGGGRWLNLFAHTGAFSAALLAAGADELVSVDLSSAYLRWLEANLEANRDAGVDASRHRAVRRDARRYLAAAGEADGHFAGIVLDPPTAAAAGRRFFSVRRDLEPMMQRALGLLERGGALFVSRNQRGARRGELERSLRRAAQNAGLKLRSIEPAAAGADFPSLEGFPEGDPFEALIARRR